jgi:hypothetical protein
MKPRSRTDIEPDNPWGAFLREIDERLTEAIQLQCLGGFMAWHREANSRLVFFTLPWRSILRVTNDSPRMSRIRRRAAWNKTTTFSIL